MINRFEILLYKNGKNIDMQHGYSTRPKKSICGNWCHETDVEVLEDENAELRARIAELEAELKAERKKSSRAAHREHWKL